MDPKNPSWIKSQSLDLFVESFSNAARTVQVRGFSEAEQILGNHTTNSDRSLATSVIQISEIPLNLTLRTVETDVQRGECYVKVSLRAEGVVIALLCAGYISEAGTPAYPNGKIESSIEGPGLLRSITGTNPAAGVEISETVPTGALWRFISLKASYNPDATVATRQPRLNFDDGANIYMQSGVGGQPTASSNQVFTWANFGAEDNSAGTANTQCIPSDIYLPAGHRVITVTTSIQAGDEWSAPQFAVEEWIQP